MSFIEAVRSCLRQYATLSGRARRSEYWWFTLAVLLAIVGMWVLLVVIESGINSATDSEASDAVAAVITGLIVISYIAVMIPTVAVAVRRLHDIGRSGWWWWLGFVPLGGFVLLVFACLDSKPDNEYGPSPKAITT